MNIVSVGMVIAKTKQQGAQRSMTYKHKGGGKVHLCKELLCMTSNLNSSLGSYMFCSPNKMTVKN